MIATPASKKTEDAVTRSGTKGGQRSGRVHANGKTESREPKNHARDEHRQRDRQDGTGRGAKKQHRNGGGKFNWGEDGEDDGAVAAIDPVGGEEEELAPVQDGEGEGEEVEGEGGEGKKKWKEEREKEPEPEPEPEVPTKSYLEYQAELAEQKKRNAELFGEVKEREVDTSDFDKLVLVEKEGEEGEEDRGGEAAAKKKAASAQRATSRQILNASFRSGGVDTGRGERGGRGGRGEGRRGGGRGGDRGGGRGIGREGGREGSGGRGRGEGGRGRGGEGGRGGREGYRGGRGGGRGGGGGGRLNIDDTNMFPTL